MFIERNESFIATSGMSTHGLELEGWKERGVEGRNHYEGWMGRREGDREHTWGGGEGKGEGEGVNRERERGRHDGWRDVEME